MRRAAAEGPRVWTKRPFFADHPESALRLLGGRCADTSGYVRKSAAHALSDISKEHPDLVLAELRSWAADPAAEWVATRACRHLISSHAEEVERVVARLARGPEPSVTGRPGFPEVPRTGC